MSRELRDALASGRLEAKVAFVSPAPMAAALRTGRRSPLVGFRVNRRTTLVSGSPRKRARAKAAASKTPATVAGRLKRAKAGGPTKAGLGRERKLRTQRLARLALINPASPALREYSRSNRRGRRR